MADPLPPGTVGAPHQEHQERRAVRTLGGRQLVALLPDPVDGKHGYRQLAESISGLILDGWIALRVGLPAERELAAALGTSRPTVTAAYDLLRESGYARSRRGSGTWTTLPEGTAPRRITRALAPPDAAIDLARAAPGLPEGVLADALRRITPALDEYAHTPGYFPYGLPELRAAVAERYTRRGLATIPDQILVTSGAQQALTLVLGLLSGPGDRIMVENPSYPNALDAIHRARLRPLAVPVTGSGWDIEIIESTLRGAVPRLAFLIPDFHNPTGLLMPEDERVRVLRAVQRSGSWLIIDETLADLALDVPPPPPFASRVPPGGAGRLITLGSMSKSHWGGLRIGWLRAPSQLVTELTGQRVANDLGGSVVDQLLALALLARSDELVPLRLGQLRERRAALTSALADHIPQWTWRTPPGGLSLWVDLGEPVASALAEHVRGYGVRVEGGAHFTTDPGVLEQHLRIPYTLEPGTLREAVQRMAAALADGIPAGPAGRRARWIV
ncbi:MocR-like transcription factor YczR [Streptomyces sp. NPDC002308]